MKIAFVCPEYHPFQAIEGMADGRLTESRFHSNIGYSNGGYYNEVL